MMKEGDAFLGAPPGRTKHLWVVITEPDESGCVVLVNVTTATESKQRLDRSCVLDVGDHPFIKHQSLINYQDALKCRADAIDAAIQSLPTTCIEQRERFQPSVLRRIKKGALESDSMPRKLKAMIKL